MDFVIVFKTFSDFSKEPISTKGQCSFVVSNMSVIFWATYCAWDGFGAYFPKDIPQTVIPSEKMLEVWKQNCFLITSITHGLYPRI